MYIISFQAGRAMDPTFLFCWPNARTAPIHDSLLVHSLTMVPSLNPMLIVLLDFYSSLLPTKTPIESHLHSRIAKYRLVISSIVVYQNHK